MSIQYTPRPAPRRVQHGGGDQVPGLLGVLSGYELHVLVVRVVHRFVQFPLFFFFPPLNFVSPLESFIIGFVSDEFFLRNPAAAAGTFSQITLLLLLFRSFPPSQEASSLSHHRPLFFLLSNPLSRTPGLAALPFPFRPSVRSFLLRLLDKVPR